MIALNLGGRRCDDCGTKALTGPRTRLCVDCRRSRNRVRVAKRRRRADPESRRARDREYKRLAHADPLRRERIRERNRAWRLAHQASSLLHNARSRAKRLGLACDLTEEDLKIPPWCPILGIPLFVGSQLERENSPSIDRIDNGKGYVKGNVQVVSLRANRIKNDATLDELRRLVAYLEKL